jgi:hypothetical protein
MAYRERPHNHHITTSKRPPKRRLLCGSCVLRIA